MAVRCALLALLVGARADERYGVQPSTGSRFASVARCHHPESESARALHCDDALRVWPQSPESEPPAGPRCGLCGQSPAAEYLSEVSRALRRLKEAECNGLVAYSVAFGAQHFALMRKQQLEAERALELVQAHGRCFFRFVLADDMRAAAQSAGVNASASGAVASGAVASGAVADAPSIDRLHFLVPLDASRLPFRGNRRNVKVLKMLGQLIFPWAQRLVWIDTKLHVGTVDPLEYFERTVARVGACAAFMGLPHHPNAFGDAEERHATFLKHAETIIRVSLGARSSVTDSRDAVREQVKTYMRETGNASHELSLNLVDSAYIAWDLGPPRCRRFNAALGCRWFDEIACFSDRDQLSFPFALHAVGARYREPPAAGASEPHLLYDPAGAPVVNIIPAAGAANDASPLRHWYYSRSVAVLPTTRTERTPAEAAIARSKELERARAAARKRSMEREWRANAHQEWRAQQKTAAHEWRVQQEMLRKAAEARADGDNDQAEIVEQEVTMERVWVRKRRVKKKKKKDES